MKIYYCDHCQKRVPEEELESGRAVIESDDKAFCADCAGAYAKPAPPPSRRAPTRGNVLPGRGQRQTPSVVLSQQPPSAAQRSGASERAPRPPSGSHPKASIPMPLVGIAVAVVLAVVIGIVVYSSSGKNPPRQPAPVTQNPAPPTPPVDPAPPVKETVAPTVAVKETRPSGLFGEMMQEHTREGDPEQRKALAVTKLKDAKEFFSKNPIDPWTYLDMLHAVPDRTPAGDEAAAAIVSLNLPLEKSGTPGWYRDWKFENKANDRSAVIQYDVDGRKNVLKTLPPGKDDEMRFSRAMKVPAAPALLSISARGAEKGDCLAVIEINGKTQLIEPLKGKTWKSIQIDLSPLAGQTATIQIRHVATGWDDETAFWTEPKISSATDSKAVAFNPNAAAFSKTLAATATREAARPFVGPREWAEPPGWQGALNVLSLADPKEGALDSDWKRLDSGALKSGMNKSTKNGARLEIPFNCPPEYSVKATFERKSGNGDAGLILAHPDTSQQFFWTIGAMSNKYVALGEVAGKRFEGNPAAVNVGSAIVNNRRYTTTVDVRKDRVSAYLDGRLVAEWTKDMGTLKAHEAWSLKNPAHIGIGSWNSEVVFYSLELAEKK